MVLATERYKVHSIARKWNTLLKHLLLKVSKVRRSGWVRGRVVDGGAVGLEKLGTLVYFGKLWEGRGGNAATVAAVFANEN